MITNYASDYIIVHKEKKIGPGYSTVMFQIKDRE